MPLFRWEDIDHSLVRLRLIDLAEEMHRQIQADEGQIRFENRGNMNSNTVPSVALTAMIVLSSVSGKSIEIN
jgi:hypothetical protein